MFCAVALGIGSCFILVPQRGTAEDPAGPVPAKTSIPWSQINARARADYQGDGLAVSPNAGGARLRCVLQRLEGEATREGRCLTSTAPTLHAPTLGHSPSNTRSVSRFKLRFERFGLSIHPDGE
jgi:hypothetical protein